jgi:hypothetical protein
VEIEDRSQRGWEVRRGYSETGEWKVRRGHRRQGRMASEKRRRGERRRKVDTGKLKEWKFRRSNREIGSEKRI